MSEHTPGPWEKKGREIWSGDRHIATIHTASGIWDEPESNAYKMAAAPEMLESLESMLREYDRLMARAGVANSAYFRGFASGAHAALAKARGE